MDYRDLTTKDIEIQKKLLAQYQDSVRGMPSGGLVCRTSNEAKEYYYFDKLTGKRKYVKKNDYKLLSAVTQRRVYEESIERMKKNIAAQEKLLKAYKTYDYNSILDTLSMSYNSWQPEEKPLAAEKAALRPEGLVHMTSCGQKVRSKTEVMIVETILSEGLPLLYEKPLKLLDENGNPFICHPDFSFKTRYKGWLYWEHFGMLGDENYRQDAMWKIERYIENGIMPSVNLMITSESADGALDVNSILNTVEFIKKLL